MEGNERTGLCERTAYGKDRVRRRTVALTWTFQVEAKILPYRRERPLIVMRRDAKTHVLPAPPLYNDRCTVYVHVHPRKHHCIVVLRGFDASQQIHVRPVSGPLARNWLERAIPFASAGQAFGHPFSSLLGPINCGAGSGLARCKIEA